MSILNKVKDKTVNLRPTSDIAMSEVKPDDKVRTGPGMAIALATAKARVEELESKGHQGTVKVAEVRPNPWQPRTDFDPEAMDELIQSIKELGLIQPILVRRVSVAEDEEYFELVAGERRWRAHQVLGLEDIKAVISEASDADMAVLALAENISRADLSDYEIAKAMRRAEKEFRMRTHLAEAMGLSRSSLYRYFAFDSLPDFMRDDLEKTPQLLGGNAASDIAAVLKKYGESALPFAKELWQQLVAGTLQQIKFAKLLEATLIRKEAPAIGGSRDIHKVYAGKEQAGSITKDAVNFTVKLKSAVLTEAQEEQIRNLIRELFDDAPRS